MATVIRMARHGTKKRPYYRLVVQTKTAPRDGKFIEHIGAFNPLKDSVGVSVERPRLEYWLSVGAKMSHTVASLLKPVIKSWSAPVEGVTEQAPAAPKAKKPAKKAAAEA